MKKIFTFLFTLLFLNACGTHSASILGNGVALLTANDIPRLAVSKGTNVLIKQKTGKTAFDHLVSNNIYIGNYWPKKSGIKDNYFEKTLRKKLCCIPVDQSLNDQHIKYIYDNVIKFN